MGITHIKCPCGQRLRQEERSVGALYLVQFSTEADPAAITRCPRCELVLYPAFKAGELKRCA